VSDFTLRGVDDMLRRLKDIDRQSRESLSDAATEDAEIMIAQRARDEFVPIKSGNLRNTIKVVKSELSQGRDSGGKFTEGSAIEIKIIAGDDTTPQALAIHEHPSPHDPPSWKSGVTFKHGGSKYLERPLNEAISGMADRVAGKVKLS
jgi:hypothetical protein